MVYTYIHLFLHKSEYSFTFSVKLHFFFTISVTLKKMNGVKNHKFYCEGCEESYACKFTYDRHHQTPKHSMMSNDKKRKIDNLEYSTEFEKLPKEMAETFEALTNDLENCSIDDKINAGKQFGKANALKELFAHLTLKLPEMKKVMDGRKALIDEYNKITAGMEKEMNTQEKIYQALHNAFAPTITSNTVPVTASIPAPVTAPVTAWLHQLPGF